MLGVDSSTYRKWESGPIVRCNELNSKSVDSFIRGEYDKKFTTQELLSWKKDKVLISAMNRANAIHNLIKENDSSKQTFETLIMKAIDTALSSLVEP